MSKRTNEGDASRRIHEQRCRASAVRACRLDLVCSKCTRQSRLLLSYSRACGFASVKITFFVIILCVSVALFAAPRPYSLEPIATLLPGTGFHGDAGFEVIDWNDDEKPDLFVYDTGSVGTGWIYLNEGSLSKPRFTHGFAFPYNITETT